MGIHLQPNVLWSLCRWYSYNSDKWEQVGHACILEQVNNSGMFVKSDTEHLEVKHIRKCVWSFIKWWIVQ